MRGIAGVILLGSLLAGLPLVRVAALEDPLSQHSSSPLTLSPYWSTSVLRWEPLILQAADLRKLDPDLLASLIWWESRGDPAAIGPGGSVGLMQIMPKEAGFSWRPSRDELLVPSTNVYWGSRTLSIIIGQGGGDVAGALAAYNGGWEKADNQGPRAFAAKILRDYAHAVAFRESLDGHWVAYFAILDNGIRGPIWVADASREDVYLYGDTNVTPSGAPLIPLISPLAVVAESETESGAPLIAGLWVYHTGTGQWIAGDRQASVAPSAEAPDMEAESERPGAVSPAVMAGSARPPAAQTPVAPVGEPTATPEVAAEGSSGPPPSCQGGALTVDTYPLDRINTPEGWVAHIFAQARGGTCTYTYAWNDAEGIRGQDMAGPIVFEVASSRRDSALLGTVVVTSGDEVVRVKLYVRPPK